MRIETAVAHIMSRYSLRTPKVGLVPSPPKIEQETNLQSARAHPLSSIDIRQKKQKDQGVGRKKKGYRYSLRSLICAKDCHAYQFHVRLDAVKTGGFHCSLAGSILRTPLIFSFSRCFLCCSMMASVRTIIQLPF